jgi:DNA-binding transcriptional regulator YiaG
MSSLISAVGRGDRAPAEAGDHVPGDEACLVGGRARENAGVRIALERIRQSLAAIAEREPASDDRSPKQVVQWLAERTEVSQPKLANLLGVSARQLQRWLSASEAAQPEGEDAPKVRAVARVVNQLRFVLTPCRAVPDSASERGRDPGQDHCRFRPTPLLAARHHSLRRRPASGARRLAARNRLQPLSSRTGHSPENGRTRKGPSPSRAGISGRRSRRRAPAARAR